MPTFFILGPTETEQEAYVRLIQCGMTSEAAKVQARKEVLKREISKTIDVTPSLIRDAVLFLLDSHE